MQCDFCDKTPNNFCLVEYKISHANCHKFCDYHKFILDKMKHNISIDVTIISKEEFNLYYTLGVFIKEQNTQIEIHE